MILTHLQSNAVAYLALLVASTGTSYAAVQLADGSVTRPKLHDDAVTSPKILDHTIRRGDLALNVLPKATPRAWFATTIGSGEDPDASPDQSIYSFPVTLPRAGSLLVTLSVPQVGVSCSMGVAYAGLYLDGHPIAGSRSLLDPDTKPIPLPMSGTIAATKGPHLLQVEASCPGGSVTATVLDPEPSWSVTLA